MQKKLFTGLLILSVVLAFGLILSGCSNSSGSDTSSYVGSWKATNVTEAALGLTNNTLTITLASNGTFSVDIDPPNGGAPAGTYSISGTTLSLNYTQDDPSPFFTTGTFTSNTTLVSDGYTFIKM